MYKIPIYQIVYIIKSFIILILHRTHVKINQSKFFLVVLIRRKNPLHKHRRMFSLVFTDSRMLSCGNATADFRNLRVSVHIHKVKTVALGSFRFSVIFRCYPITVFHTLNFRQSVPLDKIKSCLATYTASSTCQRTAYTVSRINPLSLTVAFSV